MQNPLQMLPRSLKTAVFPVFLLLALGLTSFGSGKRGQAVLISFHLEGSKEEWPKFAQAVKMSDGQQFYFKVLPVATDADIQWFYPFVSDDKTTFGAAFKLDQRGSNALAQITGSPENHGRLLAVVTQPLSDQLPGLRNYLQIDKRITDGVVVVWSGLTDQHLRVFSGRFPHVRDLMPEE